MYLLFLRSIPETKFLLSNTELTLNYYYSLSRCYCSYQHPFWTYHLAIQNENTTIRKSQKETAINLTSNYWSIDIILRHFLSPITLHNSE